MYLLTVFSEGNINLSTPKYSMLASPSPGRVCALAAHRDGQSVCGFREAAKIHPLGFQLSVPLAMSRGGTDLETAAPTNFISSRQ